MIALTAEHALSDADAGRRFATISIVRASPAVRSPSPDPGTRTVLAARLEQRRIDVGSQRCVDWRSPARRRTTSKPPTSARAPCPSYRLFVQKALVGIIKVGDHAEPLVASRSCDPRRSSVSSSPREEGGGPCPRGGCLGDARLRLPLVGSRLDTRPRLAPDVGSREQGCRSCTQLVHGPSPSRQPFRMFADRAADEHDVHLINQQRMITAGTQHVPVVRLAGIQKM